MSSNTAYEEFKIGNWTVSVFQTGSGKWGWCTDLYGDVIFDRPGSCGHRCPTKDAAKSAVSAYVAGIEALGCGDSYEVGSGR